MVAYQPRPSDKLAYSSQKLSRAEMLNLERLATRYWLVNLDAHENAEECYITNNFVMVVRQELNREEN